MTLVCEGDIAHASRRSVRVYQSVCISIDEALPFEIKRDVLGGCRNVTIHGFLAVSLAAHELIEGVQSILNSGDQVTFELLERVLYRKQVLTVIVLFQNLLVQAMTKAAVENIRVIVSVDTSSAGVKHSGV